MTVPMWLDTDAVQEAVDRFYWSTGPCCAGCDWWAHVNSTVGECRRAAPVAEKDRWGLLGFEAMTLSTGAGHVMTPREHRCGEFKDEFDWRQLSPAYLRQIGANTKT